MGPDDALQRAHEVLDYVGLGEARYRRIESYSTGMKQRLKIASAIVHDPRLLILDEPTNGMDPAGRDDVLRAGRRPGPQQGDEPAVLQPPAARRRGGLRVRHGPGPRPAAGPGADRGPQAGPQPRVRAAGQGRPGARSPAARGAGHPGRADRRPPPGHAPAGHGRRTCSGRPRATPASRSAPSGRGGARSKKSSSTPSGRNADADLRPGLPALARQALRPGRRAGWPITRHGVRVQLKNRWLRWIILGAVRARRWCSSAFLVALGPLRAEVHVPDAVPDLLPEPPRGAQGRAAGLPDDRCGPWRSASSSTSSSSSR